ncbi:trimethyllysine dioxygenase [Limibacillus halophilus]|jgi:trimethyllysine dioxygenase
MTALAQSLRIEDSDLVLEWTDEKEATRLPGLWLRDHCGCESCQHPETKQRLLDTFALPRGLKPASAEVTANGTSLHVVWAPEGHESDYCTAELRRLAEGQVDPAAPAEPHLWDAMTLAMEGLPKADCAAFMEDDATLAKALENLEAYGFILVEGVEATPEATEAVARRIAYIRETIFGGFWDFTANMEHKDTAYTTLAIGPHTDGTYAFDAPGYQMFHCLEFKGEGGDSLLVDGFKVAADIKERAPELYETLSRVEVTGQYLDHERGVHLMASRPLLRHDSRGRLVQVSYNNHDRAPFLLAPEESARFYEGLRLFNDLANDPKNALERRLLPGSMLIFDNWRALHGRKAYSGRRRLSGAYLNKEDVESRLRVLKLQGKL